VFIVGSLGDSGRSPEEILAIAEGRAGYLAQSKSKGKDTATAIGASVARMRGFGDYEVDSKSSALKARDYKDATDLVIHES
jgi:hypothetical protein